MGYSFEQYKPRKVSFTGITEIDGWKVKVYTITKNVEFESNEVLENAIANLSDWLDLSEKLDLPTYDIANLIVHEGRDGVWSLVNWWIGGEMLQNLAFYTGQGKPNEFKSLPFDGSMVCVWELSVICHERKAWIKHILKNADSPRFEDYLDDVIEGLI